MITTYQVLVVRHRLLTRPDLRRHVGHRSAGLDHQAGSLLPKLRGVLPTLARHTDNLPAGPAVPPVRCPPSGVNPTRQDLLDDVALGVGRVLEVPPVVLSKLTFGSLIIRPVRVVGAQPVAENQYPLNLRGRQFR